MICEYDRSGSFEKKSFLSLIKLHKWQNLSWTLILTYRPAQRLTSVSWFETLLLRFVVGYKNCSLVLRFNPECVLKIWHMFASPLNAVSVNIVQMDHPIFHKWNFHRVSHIYLKVVKYVPTYRMEVGANTWIDVELVIYHAMVRKIIRIYGEYRKSLVLQWISCKVACRRPYDEYNRSSGGLFTDAFSITIHIWKTIRFIIIPCVS